MKTLHIYTETQEVKIWGQITPVGNRKEYFRKKNLFYPEQGACFVRKMQLNNAICILCRELAQVQTSSLKIYKKLNDCYLMIRQKDI